MLPSLSHLRRQLRTIVSDKDRQGHETAGVLDELAALPDSYDALAAFAERVVDLPLRPDWPYVEPNDWAGVLAECDPTRVTGSLKPLAEEAAARRIEAAFLGRVCGCILGKPIEIEPSLADIRDALEPLGEWPLRDYVSTAAAHSFRRPPATDWATTVRENIGWVAPDDDLNYTVIGMLVLERHGRAFTRQDLLRTWFTQLAPGMMWGPERTTMAKAALHTLPFASVNPDDATLERWVSELNPHDEYCGALIRADAYGYAAAGNPELAAQLAWRDAGLTHRRTGLYGTMWAAAAIATAFVADDPLEIFAVAQQYIPQRSRFHAVVADSLEQVSQASDWLDGYARIHARYGEYGHCQMYQEAGTLINTLRFATDVGDGICKQVMQGNDTDSFGATAGSLLGAYFGPGHLEDRWLAPFNDEIRTKVAGFPERSLHQLAARMGRLPATLDSTPQLPTLPAQRTSMRDAAQRGPTTHR